MSTSSISYSLFLVYNYIVYFMPGYTLLTYLGPTYLLYFLPCMLTHVGKQLVKQLVDYGPPLVHLRHFQLTHVNYNILLCKMNKKSFQFVILDYLYSPLNCMVITASCDICYFKHKLHYFIAFTNHS